MQDFPSNSHRGTERSEEPKQIERVTSGEIVRRKKGLGKQFKETFISGSAREAFEYMLTDVIVPSARDLLFEAFQSGLDRLIYGDSRPRRHAPTSYSTPGHVNYAGMGPGTRAPAAPKQSILSPRARARHSFDEIIIPSRIEADEVLDRMYDILSRYGRVTVADFYALVGVKAEHTDVKWGWSALTGARIVTLRGSGHLLDLPEPESFG